MANAVLMHEPQTVRKGMIKIDGYDVAGHNVCNPSYLWRLVGHDDPPDAVPLRQDADYRSSLQDNKKADVLVSQDP
jgi:hypothetical protein